MTFEQFWAILVKRWRLIVICFLVVGVGAYTGSKLSTPLYKSTALVQIIVSKGQDPWDYNHLLASDQLVETEVTLATSEHVLSEVALNYKGLTVEQLSGEVTAASKLNTQLIEIDVQDPSPARAAKLANEVAAELVYQQSHLTGQNNLYIVQTAQPSLSPTQPHTLLNTSAGLLIGLLLGMLLAVLIEHLDTRVRTPEALNQLLNVPVLASIWLVRSTKKEPVFNPAGNDVNVESYRILRTNLGFSSIDKPLHSLMVASALSHDGRTTIAANLAIFMAKAGKTTLLIDADLRRPTLCELFGLSTDKTGLSNAVLAMGTSLAINSSPQLRSTTLAISRSVAPTADLSLEPFIHSVGIPNLWVMPSGPLPPNPSELLDSKAAQFLLREIANCGAEIVIFDTPPLLGLSDASILASKVDDALVVVDISRATQGKLKQLKAVLAQTGVHVLGCVANKQRHNRNDTAYPHYISTEDQKSEEKQSSNGYMSSVPATPSLVSPSPLEKESGETRTTDYQER